MFDYANWKRLAADGLAIKGPALLYRVSGRGTAAGLVATLYHGQNVDANNIVLSYYTLANTVLELSFGPGILLEKGLYVDFDANGLELLIAFREIDIDQLSG